MKKLLDKSLTKGAEATDIFYLERKLDKIDFKNSKLDSISAKNTSGFNLRVVKDKKLGMVSSANFNRNDEVLDMALESSKEGDTLEYEFNRPTELPEIKLTNDSLWDRPLEEYIAEGEKVIQIIKDYDPKINVEVKFDRQRETKKYLNTFGCDYTNKVDNLHISVGVELVQEQSMLEIGKSVIVKSHDYDIEKVARELIDKVKIGRNEVSITPGKIPVLLTPDAVFMLMFVLNAGLSGEFVRLGISPLKDKIGEQIFSEKLTIIDDMTLANGIDSAAFDDEGTPAQRTYLFENGVLRNYLLDLKSAHALNLQPNGKAARRFWFKPRDYSQTPGNWFSNCLIEPGNVSLEEMIADIKEGLVIDNMFGLIMGNLVRGDVDSDIDLAYKIENGKIVGRVKDAAIGANLYELLKDQVVAVENKQHHALTMTGDMLFPHILVKDVNIVV
ncbi:MAG: TldD/PmbA family protein [Desulfobacterales bacterium]|nr:TldD/PmbA family protein [Desulfobacterales bacterium]